MNCLDCPSHKVIADPDPYDSFCSDDVAVICTLMTQTPDNFPKYYSDAQEFKCVTISCRPYNKRKESETPDWCPKI